jgi:hypothetical protein
MDTRQAASLLTKLLAGATINTSATETDKCGNENNQDAGDAGNTQEAQAWLTHCQCFGIRHRLLSGCY